MSNKVYEIITEKIIERLNAGEVPWHKPWTGAGMPKNLVSKKEYRGINAFLLACQGYTSPYWLTFKQCKALGGSVQKGAKSTVIVFWKQVQITDKETEEQKTIPMLRYYRVFNADQCTGLGEKVPVAKVNPDFQPITECENIVNGMQNKPAITHQDPRAYYRPSTDTVNMPNKKTFVKPEFYYSVLFHELGHSTGHKDRLGRKDFSEVNFGSQTYSKEELVAEMTAAFCCGHAGIENKTLENSTAYIQGWARKFKDNVKMVVLAAAGAQKAADYILNR